MPTADGITFQFTISSAAFTYLFISSDGPERLEKILTISDAEG
jgi:hypothetical protein